MASPVELAVVELQIVVRELTRRLTAIEQRLGLQPEEFAPRTDGPKPYVPLARERRDVVTRTAETANDPYEIAATGNVTEPAETPVPAATSITVPEPPVTPETYAAVSDSHIEHRGGEESKIENAGPLPVLPPQLPPRPIPPAKKVADFLRQYNPPPKPQSTLERTLGIEVASWLAGLAIIGGILFFLQGGVDNATAFFTPALRVLIALLAGLLMTAHGTLLHVRGLKAISAALLGSGLAILMAALFAANIAYAIPVLSQAQAFFAIPLVAALGLALGLYTRSVMLPILAFAGMYLSPAILNAHIDRSLPFLVYVLVVTGAALVLAQVKSSWEHLRLLAIFGGWVSLIAWTDSSLAAVHEQLGMAAIFMLFLIILAVLAANLHRAARHTEPTPAQEIRLTYWDATAALFSLINTATAAFTFGLLFKQAHLHGLGVSLAFMGVVMGALSLALRTKYFSLSAAIQAVALFLAALPLYLDRGTIAPGYAFLALGFGLYAQLTNSQFSRICMFAAVVLMAGQFFAFDAVDTQLQSPLFTAAGTEVTPWMLIGWGAGLLALVLAWLSRPTSRHMKGGAVTLRGASWATMACIALSTLLVFVVNIRALPPGGPFTLAAVIWLLALLAVLRCGALADIGSAVETLMGVLLMLLWVKWLMFDGITIEAAPILGQTQSHVPLFNLFTLNGILIAAAILFLSPFREVPTVGRRFIAWWITALAFTLLNIQALRGVDYFMAGIDLQNSPLGRPEFVKSVALTALWALFASGMIAWGFTRKSPSIRYVALALLALAVVKILFVDLATADTPLRFLAFMTLGILLFIVTYLYHRHQKQLPGAA